MMMTLLKAGACAAAMAAMFGFALPAQAQTETGTPRYEVDLSWPKPLPDKWVLGGLGGLCVDANDHVLIMNRQDVLDVDLNAGKQAPHMIEFDPAGNIVNTWGDDKLLDDRLHSCHFDGEGNVWVASAPSGMIQKYSHDGKRMLLQIGPKGKVDSSDGTDKGKPLNSNAAIFFMVSSIYVDRGNGDIYVSDGEGSGSNRRIAVMDKTGKFLRQWKQEDMETVHCLTMARDGTVYVCNRLGKEIRLFDKMGNLKSRIATPWMPVTPPAGGVAKETGGAAVAIDFSPDPQQRLMYVINQNSATIDIYERTTGKKLTSFGRAGSYPGEFHQAHGIAVDSKGNVYLAENRGRRVQKFKIAGQ